MTQLEIPYYVAVAVIQAAAMGQVIVNAYRAVELECLEEATVDSPTARLVLKTKYLLKWGLV